MESKRGGEWCSAINCTNSRLKNKGMSFFRFPKDTERCKIWVINSGRQDLLNKGVDYIHMNCRFCANHFEVDQCMNPRKNKLIWNAVPTIFDISERPFRHRRSVRQAVDLKREACSFRRTNRKSCVSARTSTTKPGKKVPTPTFKNCLYVYCRNSSRYENKAFMEGIFFLPVPSAKSNLAKRKRWLESCGRLDLSRDRSTDKMNFHVCSVHFVGGNGPTRSNPDPIPHRVAQKKNSVDGRSKIRVLRCEDSPLLPRQTELKNRTVSGEVNDLHSSIKTVSSQSNGRPAQLYEVTVRELPSIAPEEQYSLSDIRANYTIPVSWTMCVASDSLYFARMNPVTDSVLVKLTINKDMSTKVQALSRDLDPSHPVLTDFPKTVADSKTLDKCFVLLRPWHICFGNNERAFISLFSQLENKSGFVSRQTGSVHSPTCTLLTQEKSVRCKLCQMQRGSLRSLLRRFLNNYDLYCGIDEKDENQVPEDSRLQDNQVTESVRVTAHSADPAC